MNETDILLKDISDLKYAIAGHPFDVRNDPNGEATRDFLCELASHLDRLAGKVYQIERSVNR